MELEDVKKALEDIKKALEEARKTKADSKKREVMMLTGRQGAMWKEQLVREASKKIELGRKLTPAEQEEIKQQVHSQRWEEGVYRTNPDTGILEYKGLWDNTVKDGTYLLKKNGYHYIEWWSNGYRYEHEIISEERFNQIKNEIESNRSKMKDD